MASNENYDDTCINCSEEEEFTLSITRNEALYLDDCFTLMVEREFNMDSKSVLTTLRNVLPTAQLPVPIELIDKLAWAVLYTTEEGNSSDTEATLTLDSSEIYILREVAQSYIRIGDEPVGFNLKRKIYYALFEEEFQREKNIDRLIEEALPSSDNNDIPIVVTKKTVKESPPSPSKR